MKALTASFGANSIANGCRDLWYSGTGQGDKSGKKDFLRDGTSAVTGAIGKPFGQEKAGEVLGEFGYYALDFRYSFSGIKKAFETVKSVDYVKTTCFFNKIEFNPRVVEVRKPIQLLVDANAGKCAKDISSFKLVSIAKKLWDRSTKIYEETVQLNNAHKE